MIVWRASVRLRSVAEPVPVLVSLPDVCDQEEAAAIIRKGFDGATLAGPPRPVWRTKRGVDDA